MWKSRTAIIRKKPKIVLDNARFPITSELNLGDNGQFLMKAIVDSERLEFQEDDVERIIKTARILDIKIITNKTARV